MDNLQRDLQGVVKGARWQVSPGIIEMNRRANSSSHAAPWHGNRPGGVRSNAFQNHMLSVEGWEDVDVDFEEDYSYDYDA